MRVHVKEKRGKTSRKSQHCMKTKKEKRTVDSDKKAEISLKVKHTHIWNDKRSVSKPNT